MTDEMTLDPVASAPDTPLLAPATALLAADPADEVRAPISEVTPATAGAIEVAFVAGVAAAAAVVQLALDRIAGARAVNWHT